jgi:putative Mg2+ transporter-C (MgtC) family protein
METLLREITSSTPSAEQAIRVLIRLFAATRLVGIVGYERQTRGKSAGLRTRMLVAIGSAMFVLAPLEAGMAIADVSRVVQGVAAGIGFIGAGAILKLKSEKEIQGLTTAAGVWMTAAIGLAAGMGRLGLAASAPHLRGSSSRFSRLRRRKDESSGNLAGSERPFATPGWMVGATGFEPAASRSRTERSTKLSHAPTTGINAEQLVYRTSAEKPTPPRRCICSGFQPSGFQLPASNDPPAGCLPTIRPAGEALRVGGEKRTSHVVPHMPLDGDFLALHAEQVERVSFTAFARRGRRPCFDDYG